MTKMIVLLMPNLSVPKSQRARARERARERDSALARDSAHVGLPTCAALHGVGLHTHVQRRSAPTPRMRSLFDFSVG